MTTAKEVIDLLGLEPLGGEGGYFRQTWIEHAETGRPLGTAILYLITPESFSGLHRLDADEVFHFYLGDACEQVVIHPDGAWGTTMLGSDIVSGQQIQSVVPKHTWQGTRLLPGGSWALVGTTMAPGYLQSGFELATSESLAELDPELAARAFRFLADGA